MPGMTTVREAVFALLRDFGLNTIFGNPGSTELPMYRDFPADFRYVLGLQESVVVAMADGFAQARRTAALVNLHSAIGVGHAVGSLFATTHRSSSRPGSRRARSYRSSRSCIRRKPRIFRGRT